ncbi:phage portal protein [Oceanibacterium hippocampi]|uniref:Phage portal protein, lambda family n=1 Tax=Oceanibacterium hippocampi TaxID=745714 RepID=A0A1Y5TZN6_9PROT|nr:phage portal protein [Oceanibacterium hippocampi]SLN77292.1 Phage portal protein, lambda family [Oceanibacterium hippocampi]
MALLDIFRPRAAAPNPATAPSTERVEPTLVKRRSFKMAKTGRLNAGWSTQSRPMAQILKADLSAMRARSNDLAQNDPYMRRFLSLCKSNIVGPDGVQLLPQARRPNGDLDEADNRTIAAAWKKWQRVAMVTGQTFRTAELTIAASVPRDGEILIRMVTGWRRNEFGFALQLIGARHLDHRLNFDRPNGNRVRLGIEYDAWQAPAAYWITTEDPTVETIALTGKRHRRIPASEIIHLFVGDWDSQGRGIPWVHAAGDRLEKLGAYEEAALVAARIGASKMGFFEEAEPDAYTNPGEDGESDLEFDDRGDIIQDAEPGHFERLPAGVQFKDWNPDYPSGEFEPFRRAMLHGVSGGVDLSYASLTGDLSQVNFSSTRYGDLQERASWRLLQSIWIDIFYERLKDAWLEAALLTGALDLPPSKIGKFREAAWQPRGWEEVDRAKAANADKTELRLGLSSRTEICARRGRSFETIVDQLAAEQAYAARKGVDVSRFSLEDPAATAGNDEKETDNA